MLLLAILGLLIAKFLSVESFGITRTVTAYMVVLAMLGHFCFHDAVASFVGSSKSDDEKVRFVANGTYIVVIISLLIVLFAELFIGFSGLWPSKLKSVLSYIILLLPFISLTTVYTSLLQAVGSYRKLTKFTILAGLIQLLFIVPLCIGFELSGWIIGRALAAAITFIIAAHFISNYFSLERFDISTSMELASFARVQIISGFLSMFLQSADIIALERLHGDMTQIATYGLASLFSKSILFLPGAVGRVYFRDIAESADNPSKMWKSIFTLLIFSYSLCLLIAIFVYFLGPYAIKYFYGEKYVSSTPVLRILCIGIIFSGVWSALSVVNIATRNPRAAVSISLSGVITAALLLFLLVPSYGAFGAAWGVNLAYAAGTVVGLLILCSKWKESRQICWKRRLPIPQL